MMGRFYTPSRNQGQIVEFSYAAVEGYVIRRMYDRSGGTTEYDIRTALVDDEGDYRNGAPKNQRWRKITEAEANQYLGELA